MNCLLLFLFLFLLIYTYYLRALTPCASAHNWFYIGLNDDHYDGISQKLKSGNYGLPRQADTLRCQLVSAESPGCDLKASQQTPTRRLQRLATHMPGAR